MSVEHYRPNGNLSQGYVCCNCGKPIPDASGAGEEHLLRSCVLEGIDIMHRMLSHDLSLAGSDHGRGAAPFVLAQHREVHIQVIKDPHGGHSQGLLSVCRSAACEIYDLAGFINLGILGNPAQSLLLLALIGISVCFDQFREEGLLAIGAVSTSDEVGAHGLPEIDGLNARLADRSADSAGGAVVHVLGEELHLVLFQGLASVDLRPQAVVFGHQLSPAGVLIHGSDAGPIRSDGECRAPLHTLLASIAAIYLQELGGHHIARHQGL